MKTKFEVLLLMFVLLLSLNFHVTTAHAQGTTFTYQGRLNDGATPVNGHYDFQFILFNVNQFGFPVGPILTNANVSVNNGLFTAPLDFGGGVFTGSNYWLEISVRTNGTGAFVLLTPRQPVTPTPYSIMANSASNLLGTLASAQLTGTYSGAVAFSNGADNFNGTFTGNGAGVTNVNATTLGGLSSSNFWKIGGNAGTSSGFIGTTDNQPFDVRVNNTRVMRYLLTTDALGSYTNAPNVIGGSPVNVLLAGVVGATIAGGGGNPVGGGAALLNTVSANFGTVGGGAGNLSSSSFATVAGGYTNTASGLQATVGGGQENTASGLDATVGGGERNTASFAATVAGGVGNTASGDFATVGGGLNNIASGDAATVGGGDANTASGTYATVPGGDGSIARGEVSFAAGRRAKADDDGSFVWADSNNFDFHSTTTNQFRVRATGGVAFATAINGSGNVTAGVHLVSGDTAWSSISDRNAKKNFRPVNGEAVLEKLAAMPVQAWNYKWESDTNTPHLGPMAQDFKAAFYPGRDDKSISTLEFDGVELAAIQGLNQKLEQKETEITELKQRLEKLERLLEQRAPTH